MADKKQSLENDLLQGCNRCGNSTEKSMILYQNYATVVMEILEGHPFHTVKQVVDAGVFCSINCLCAHLAGDE